MGPSLPCRPTSSKAAPGHFCFPCNHTEGRGPDRRRGRCRCYFLQGHFLMLLAVTESEWGHSHCHGFSLGSTLSTTLCCSVISLPRTSKPLHARHSKPGLQVLWKAKYGHRHTVAIWVGTRLQRTGGGSSARCRQGSQCCTIVNPVSPQSLCGPGPPLPPGRGPPLPPLPLRVLPCTGTPIILMPARPPGVGQWASPE